MKICLITSVYALSETDRNGSFLVESTKYLIGRGHEVRVFAPSYEGRKSHSVQGVLVYRFRYFFRRWENLTHGEGAPTRIRNPFYLFIAIFYIVAGSINAVKFCRQEKFDVIHVHWPFPHGIWGYVASKISGTPMVLTFHGAEVLLSKRYFFVKYFLKHAINHSKGVICNSTYTASEVKKFTERTIQVIPFGSTVTSRFSPKNTEKKVKVILFAGRLIARKGVDFLIRSIPHIDRYVPVRLHVVGDGNMAAEWKALARQVETAEEIKFHGFVSNKRLEELYATADVFVLPAIVDDRGDTEGLGVVLVEALSFGTPVVASAVGGIPDVIKDGKTGLLVPEKNSPALADAIVKILTDQELQQRLAAQGLEYVRHYFDWNRLTDMLLAAYENAAA